MAGRGERWYAGIIALAGAVLAVPFLTGISMLDEGTLVHIADRIASGEVLYRDVATGVMPGSYYLQALVFVAFGRSLLVGRILMVLLFAIASATVFLIARRLSSRTVALAAALSFMAVSVHYWRFPGYSPQAIFLILLTLAAASAFIDGRRPLWLIITGLGLGATILFKQNYGTFASLGVAMGLVAAAPDVRRAVRDVATAAIVAASPIALTAVLFACVGAWSEFWSFTVGVPLQVPYTVFTRPWPPLFTEPEPRIVRDIVYYLPFEELAIDIKEWLLSHQWIAITAVRVTYYLPPLFLLVSGVLWARERARVRRSPEPLSSDAKRSAVGALYLGTSAFLFLGIFPRVDAHHLFMVLAPSFLLAAWLAGPNPGRLVRRSAVVVSGFALALSILSQIASVLARHPEEIRDAFVDHPRARIWVERWQATQLVEHLERLEERVPKTESVFVAPSSPMYYFLSERSNPTRFPLILPGALDEEEVVRTLDSTAVRFALISDIAFEHFPFQYVAPTVWEYLDRNFVPAEGAGWDVAPFAPYLYERGRAAVDRIDQLTAAGSDQHAEDAGRSVVTVPIDGSKWTEVVDLVDPPLSPAPIFQTVTHDDWMNDDPYLVEWQSAYLEPSLVMHAPGGWRKALVSWEVTMDEAYSFEFACAIVPWAWAGWVEGQGALVEVWVSSSPEAAPPRRVFMEWLNPRDVADDRRWHRRAVELSSFVQTRKAIVTLVVGPAPTFIETDATVAWSGLQLVAQKHGLDEPISPSRPPRNIRLDQGAARRMLAFEDEDLEIFQGAARKYPDLGGAHIALAEVAAFLGHHELALSAAETAVRVDPQRAYYWIRLGQELQHAGRLADAIDAMESALSREPANANYHAALAAARLNLPNELEDAKAGAQAALRLDPNNTWAWTLLAKAEERLGNVAEAIPAAERSIELAPNEAWPRLTLAGALIAGERTAEALTVLERAAMLEMDSSARAELARNFLACARPERALDEALAAIAEEPSSIPALTVLGHAEVALQHWATALHAWQEVVRLDPRNSSALVQLARSLAMMGRGDEAFETIVAARALAEDEPAHLREVAIVLDEIGSTVEALSVWRRVQALAPEGPMQDEARRRLAAARPSG